MKYEEYDRHIGYCGSKTKKCDICGRNVQNKDEDSHMYGGECEALREQDKLKKEQDEKRKIEEAKRKAEDDKRRHEEEK